MRNIQLFPHHLESQPKSNRCNHRKRGLLCPLHCRVSSAFSARYNHQMPMSRFASRRRGSISMLDRSNHRRRNSQWILRPRESYKLQFVQPERKTARFHLLKKGLRFFRHKQYFPKKRKKTGDFCIVQTHRYRCMLHVREWKSMLTLRIRQMHCSRYLSNWSAILLMSTRYNH